MHSFETVYNLKCALLVQGCKSDPYIQYPDGVFLKRIHLYSHSDEKIVSPIPDDIILDDLLVCRIRYNSKSPFIIKKNDQKFFIEHETTKETTPISFIHKPAGIEEEIEGNSVSSICSFLSKDLLGVTPSNYCFYFGNKSQCRFCEILQTYKNEVEYPKTFKKLDVIQGGIQKALTSNKDLKYLAITSGNLISYDYTFDYFIDIGKKLTQLKEYVQLDQVLATLMPPDDLSKIDQLYQNGFTKIYFPLEVFNKSHFEVVCPGKASYGYDKIIQALKYAINVFGKGNVYTNFVYGVQSLNQSLNPNSFDPALENKLSLLAVDEMLDLKIIPAFTLYHFGGYNSIGKIQLSSSHVESFFRIWGEKVQEAKIIPAHQSAVLFGAHSLSNTLFNDGFRLSEIHKDILWTQIKSS
jgi:hypothetical protein